MKAIILAGGMGTRLSEETSLRPKPMVEIGGKPILWHIMKIYSHYGINDFIICLGYKGYVIKEYFHHYWLYNSNVTFNIGEDKIIVHDNNSESWNVTLVDTGLSAMTGGRLLKAARFLEGESRFFMTYGDGLSDVDINRLLLSHEQSGGLVTLTAARPPGRFGALDLDEQGRVSAFQEKLEGLHGWINGGFFVVEKSVLSLIAGDACIWETHILAKLASRGQLAAFQHQGFWQPMDTLREKLLLENLWSTGSAPWKVWD